MKVPKKGPQPHPNDVLRGKLKNASKLYEQQFLGQMVKAMRSTVSHSSMTKPSMAENIYKEQLDSKYVESWSDNGGTGFADLIYKDLVEKYFPHLKEPKRGLRPKPLTDRFRGFVKTPKIVPKEGVAKTPEGYLLAIESSEKSTGLRLPWRGRLENAFTMPNGKQVARFSHGLGLESSFVFEGRVAPGQTNNIFNVGENFAQLAPNANSLIWQVHRPEPSKNALGGTEEEF